MFPESNAGMEQDHYDACLCELTPFEVTDLPILYDHIRARVKAGGQILVNVFNSGILSVGAGIFMPYDQIFPSKDVSIIHFHGNMVSAFIRRIYFLAAQSYPRYPLLRAVVTGLMLVTLAPFSWLSNMAASKANPRIYKPHWTTATIRFHVVKQQSGACKPDLAPVESQLRPSQTLRA